MTLEDIIETILGLEIIDENDSGVVLADCVFQRWFMREFM